eukprot:Nk52_evm20s277 gene=Nk52_evmTU20s277
MVKIQDISNAPGDDEHLSDNEDECLDEETLVERICALKELVPDKQRAMIYDAACWVGRNGWQATRFGGKALWVLSTTALLLVVPLGMEIEKEQMMAMYEQEEAQKRQLVNSPKANPAAAAPQVGQFPL